MEVAHAVTSLCVQTSAAQTSYAQPPSQPAVIRAPRPTAGDHDEFSLTPTALDSPKGKRTSGWDHLLSRNSTNSKIPLQVRPIMRKFSTCMRAYDIAGALVSSLHLELDYGLELEREELSRSKPKGPDLKSRSLKKTISSRTLGGFTHTVVNGITDFTFAAASAADITIRTLNMLNPMGRDTLRRQASIAPLPSEPGTPQEEDEDSKRQRMNALLVVQREEFRKALDERNRPPHWWFIHPESQSLQAWGIVVMWGLLYTLAHTPVRMAFDTEKYGTYSDVESIMEWIVYIIFCCDVPMNCATGVYLGNNVADKRDAAPFAATPSFRETRVFYDDDEDDALRARRTAHLQVQSVTYKFKHIMYQYQRGFLWVDLLCIMPWEWFQDAMLSGAPWLRSISLPRLLKLFRMTRLLKIVRAQRSYRTFEGFSRYFPMWLVELVKLSFYTCILVHYLSCGFYYISTIFHRDMNWFTLYLDRYDPDWPNIDSLSTKYLAAMYWGFTTITTVGYGDIVPHTNPEKLYSIFVMYCGVALMSMVTGKLTTLLHEYVQQRQRVQATLRTAYEYCKHRNLPRDMRRRVMEYFTERATQQAMCNEQLVLNDLSPPLKAEVTSWMFRDVIASVPFLHGCAEQFLSAVLCCMQPVLFAPSDVMLERGQMDLSMYLIIKGRALVTSIDYKILTILKDGQFTGEIGLFFGVPRTATVVAVVFCDTFKLTQAAFTDVLAMYPEIQQKMDSQTDSFFTNMRCYTCNQRGHISVQCKMSTTFLHNVELAGASVNGRTAFRSK